MRGFGVDVGPLGVLPIQAAALDTPAAVTQWLGSVGPSERSRQIAAMSKSQLTRFTTLLDAESGADLLGSIDVDLAARVVRASETVRAAGFLDGLAYDDAAEILRELSDFTRAEVLGQLTENSAATLRDILRYPPQSVAAHMIPDVFTVHGASSAADAEASIREQAMHARGKARAGALIYVTDEQRRLIGVVDFQDLVLADPAHVISELMDGDPFWALPTVDAEDAANTLIDHELTELPIVAQDHQLLGVLTADAAAAILEDEATEDAERQGGSEPLEVPYLRASPLRLWRKRIVWLLVLFIAEAYTGTVLRAFEDELEAVVALAFFIPLLIGTGGNTGTQITTTLVRAMATGDVRFRDIPRVLGKELSTGFLVAATMAAAAVVRAWTLGVGPEVTVTVAVTVAAIVMWSSFIASILPLVLKKLRVDPAVVSAPMIATIVDGTGLIIYFLVAHATLPQLAGL